MPLPFTNVHIHVFNSRCAPDNFLRILPKKFVRKRPEKIKDLLESSGGRNVISALYRFRSKRGNYEKRQWGKMVSFLETATETAQYDVFLTAFEAGKLFDPDVRLVGLTLNMDYMDSAPSDHQSFETQLNEVMAIKRWHPKNFYPFLGIDPRHKTGANLEAWAKPYFETKIELPGNESFPYFAGLKMYPALGFFPFDPALKEIYAYAVDTNLPIITHCTRVGSQYIGDQIEGLIPDKPPVMNFEKGLSQKEDAINAEITAVHASIVDRIAKYRAKGWIKNSKIGDNDVACDLFGHPENYVPVMKMFPKLKLCLAHMGGTTEFTDETDDDVLKEIRLIDKVRWFERIKALMMEHKNLYTDISYTLSDFAHEAKKEKKKKFIGTNTVVLDSVMELLKTDSPFGDKLGDRVLFGTDFFMTEQERSEPELYSITKARLGEWWDRTGRDNPERFLMLPGA